MRIIPEEKVREYQSGLIALRERFRNDTSMDERHRRLFLVQISEAIIEVEKHALLLPPYDEIYRRDWEARRAPYPAPSPTAAPSPAPVPKFPKPKQAAKPITPDATNTGAPKDRPKRGRPAEPVGLVYLLRSDTGHFKIGHTRNLKKRRALFGVTLPFGFEILHTIPSENRLAAEQQLHARFADRRNNGEWFDLTAEDVAYIKSLTAL